MKKIILLFAVVASIALVGCSGSTSDDGLSPQEKQSASRLDDIAKKSGGDWDKLSQEDRDFLVKDLSMGSEISARKLLEGKAGKLKASPGGAQPQ